MSQPTIGRRSFLRGTGLTALGLPHLFGAGRFLHAEAPAAEQQPRGPFEAARAPQAGAGGMPPQASRLLHRARRPSI